MGWRATLTMSPANPARFRAFRFFLPSLANVAFLIPAEFSMTFQLPELIERSVLAAVQSGRFPSVDDAVTAAWVAFDGELNQADSYQVMTLDDLHRQMLEEGMLLKLPDAAQDIDDDDEPIVIEGEPLSETIIRERR